MEKTTILTHEVKDGNGNTVANMITYLSGDGSTPIIQTNGTGGVVGYADNGEVILDDNIDNLIEIEQKKMMAEAIKEQKNLCVENGVDPSLVNYFGAEKEGVGNNG
ncbi:hypothetical protein [Ligilactobacillus salivarius]|jgi:hypothetical protein|uniref:hypothetical protein n=1 Tax=Ligilactobacillus salivarius TaxID=1624 RepID=UPI00136E3F8A|nr:hypothetical protein [Ligilactobacillus salivarius]MYV10533.1 hypothetical protein [Ligilactobacillus salivarius]